MDSHGKDGRVTTQARDRADCLGQFILLHRVFVAQRLKQIEGRRKEMYTDRDQGQK
jgi:hypothetical protein